MSEFQEGYKALQRLIAAYDIPDRMANRLIDAWAQQHSELRAMISKKGFGLDASTIDQLLADFNASYQEQVRQLLADYQTEIDRAVQEVERALDDIFMAFEPAYPAGVAVTPGVLTQFAAANTIQRIVQVTDEMRRAIEIELRQGVMMQRRPFQVMQRIANIVGFRNMSGFRELGTTGISAKAERIVRTEMMTTLNAAFREKMDWAAQHVEGLQKVWLATGDWRTRDTHLDAHGQIVPYDGYFTVGGAECQFPLDPTLPLRERVNCRCRAVPYKPEWGTPDEMWGSLNEKVAFERDRRAGAGLVPKGGFPSMQAVTADTHAFIKEKYGVPFHSFKYRLMRKWEDISAQHFDLPRRWKDTVVRRLSEKIKVHYDSVNRAIKTWAKTSNKTYMSARLQQVAAKTFPGVQTTTWQDDWYSKLSRQAAEVAGREGALEYVAAFEKYDVALTGELSEDALAAGFKNIDDANAAFLRAMYEETQELLREEGIDYVVAYRGATVPKELGPELTEGSATPVKLNAMSSWSLSEQIAEQFAVMDKAADELGVVYEALIPRERIIATPFTGFGCLREYELVVLGGDFNDAAWLMQVIR